MGTRYLGGFEQAVLFALLHLGKNAYGVTIRSEIEGRTGRRVSIGAVYTTLDRLEAKGLVSSWTGDPTPSRGGRAKRFFKIEAAGVSMLTQFHDAYVSFAHELLITRGAGS